MEQQLSKKTSLTKSSIHFPHDRDPRIDDFDAFYESWYPRAVAIAAQKGVPDPEAAAQECMMALLKSDYLDQYRELHRDCYIPVQGKAVHLGHEDKTASLDTWVGNILYRRIISMQRRELRRKSIAQMEAIGNREFSVTIEHGMSLSLMGDFRDRMREATDIIRSRYPEWYPLWKAVFWQVMEGRVTAGFEVDRRELASGAGMTQADLEEAVDEFIEVAAADDDLADLFDLNRPSATAL